MNPNPTDKFYQCYVMFDGPHLRIQGTEDIGGEKGLGVEGPAGRKLWIGGGLSKAPAVRGAPISTHYLYFHSATICRESSEVLFSFFLYAHLLLLGFLIENQFVHKWSSAVCMLYASYASRYLANSKDLIENPF